MCRSCASPAAARYVDLRRRQRPIADGQAADLHRRGDVALNQRRRHAQRLRDVVEALARAIGRQQRAHVDVERRAGRESRWRTRCDSADAAPASSRLAPATSTARSRRVSSSVAKRRARRARARRAARRHHAGADLPDDLLPRLGVGADARDVQRVERQAASLRALVVAGDAVLLEERRFRRRWRRRRRPAAAVRSAGVAPAAAARSTAARRYGR